MSDRSRPRLLRSELVKLLTLRSVVIAALVTLVLPATMSALTAPSVGEAIASRDPDLAPGTVPEAVGLEWVVLGQIGIIVIGVVAGSSEFTGRQIATSLIAVPDRLRLLGAKSLALLIVTLVVGAVAVPALSLLTQAGVGSVGVLGHGLPPSLVGRWIGAVAFWVGVAQIAFATAVLMRQTILPLFLLIAVSQLSLILVVLTPWSRFLPTVAGVQLFDPTSISAAFPQAALSASAAGACLGGWIVLLVGVAALRFHRRDVRS